MISDDNRRKNQDGLVVAPHVTILDLGSTWIGLGAALDWITMRGQSLDLAQYRKREEQAYKELVVALGDLPTQIAEDLVRGEKEDVSGPLVPLPAGIWRQTAISDADDAGKHYRLIGTDDDDEWDGAVLGIHVPGYRRVQIRSSFVRDNWPEHRVETNPVSLRQAVSRADLRRLIERVMAAAPAELRPLTQAEITQIVRRLMPGASRDSVRELIMELQPNRRRGPRGPRNRNRANEVAQFGDSLLSAELHN